MLHETQGDLALACDFHKRALAFTELRPGPRLFVGRAEPGGEVVVLLHRRAVLPPNRGPFAPPKPLDLGEGRSIVPRAVLHKTSTCEVSLFVPVLKATAITPETNQVLVDAVVAQAMGPSVPDRSLPSPEEVRCEPGLGSDESPYVVDGGYEAVSLGHGWVNLRIEGYARTGGASANVSGTCFLVDLARGRLYRSRELLDDDQRKTLTQWVERRLRMDARNARLDAEDSDFFENAAAVSPETSLCLSPDGLEVAFYPGEVTKHMPTRGPSVLIPKARVTRLVASGSPLAELLRQP
ncbi:MAG: hypothetical protein JW940_04830 [Polyangiaceae bacterium]|nr:hypothetical protein [Polyangiaceae bacterium]